MGFVKYETLDFIFIKGFPRHFYYDLLKGVSLAVQGWFDFVISMSDRTSLIKTIELSVFAVRTVQNMRKKS